MQEDAEEEEEEGAVGEEEQVLVIPGPLMALTLGARGSLNATVAVIERKASPRICVVHFNFLFAQGPSGL